MTNFNKHLAETNNSIRDRVVLVYKSLPENPTKALVIKVDSISRSVDRDELLLLSELAESQGVENFADILHKKNLLSFFHTSGYLSTMDVDDISQLLPNGHRVSLRQIVDSLNHAKGLAPLPQNHQLQNLSSANPRAQEFRDEVLETNNKKGVARNIMMEARLLAKELDKKLREAYSLDPSLMREGEALKNTASQVLLAKNTQTIEEAQQTPVATTTQSVVTEVKKTVSQQVAPTAKRRGRPKKAK